MMKKHFKEYTITNVPVDDMDPTTQISGRMVLMLDRYLKSPYILNNKNSFI